nr:MFS transporter [Candidatus Sigynarchaeota archaeon]
FIDVTNQGGLFSWLLLWEILFRLSYASTTPYQSLMAELFPVHQRPKVSQFQNVFNYIGNGVMAVLTLLVFTGSFDAMRADPSVVPASIVWSVVAFGVIVVALFVIICIFLPTEPRLEIKSNLLESLVKTVKNKKFLLVVLMQGISGFGWSIITAVMLTYADVVLDLQMIEYVVVALCLLLGIFVFLNFWRKSIEKKGKKQTLVHVFLLGVFFLPITLLGLFTAAIPPIIIGIIFILGIAAILGGWFLFPYILYADLAEDDKKSTGELRAGIYAGFPSIVLNIFQAAGALLLGTITALPAIIVGGNSFSLGLIIWGPICSAILALSMFYTKRFVDLDFKWEKS